MGVSRGIPVNAASDLGEALAACQVERARSRAMRVTDQQLWTPVFNGICRFTLLVYDKRELVEKCACRWQSGCSEPPI